MGKDITYLKEDLKKYKKLNRKLESENYSVQLLDITYDTPETNNIKIPNRLFSQILTEKRPDLIKYTPFKIIVKELIRGDNPWLKKTTKLGLNDWETGNLKLYLDLEVKHQVLPFLWLLFHEFRHNVQSHNLKVLSCLDNKNRDMWLNYYGKNIDSVKHVFHEVDPLEVDANTFACEILNIPYPNSMFSITKKTLKRLK